MMNAISSLARVSLVHASSLIPWLSSLYFRAIWEDPSASDDLFVALIWDLFYNYATSAIGPGYYLVLAILSRVVIWFVFRRVLDRTFSAAETAENGEQVSSNSTKPAPGSILKSAWTKPLILPCRTTHSRVFPRKHSFSYSYLFVGIPVGWSGRINSLLSADASRKRGWFHVDPADFLARGDGHLGLRGKLDAYLETQDESPQDYPCAYLVTAPKFLGYSFNPVSFWYLYSAQKRLSAMILEVNNTFDERRMYFLKASDVVEHDQGSEDDQVVEATGASKTPFVNQWKKDFHVSPFNSRDGSYQLIAHDPAPFSASNALSINNTIILLSSQSHKKLVARVFSTAPAIDPADIGVVQKMLLIAKWGWVGFVTFPRILREAWKLYFQKSLEVFFRPEVAQGSIARHATQMEKTLESFFFEYLQHVVNSTPLSIAVTYRPALGTGTHDKAILRSRSAQEHADKECEFAVLSPAFYSRFVHYAHTSEAMDREFLCTDVKNRTISLTNPEGLAKLFSSKARVAQTRVLSSTSHGLVTRTRWRILQWLRCEADSQAYPAALEALHKSNTRTRDIRRLPLSDMDRFVMRFSPQASVYRRRVTLLFLAQRFAFGFVGVVSWVEMAGKFLLVALVARWSARYQNGGMAVSVGGERVDVEAAISTAIGCSAVLHFWSLVKGMEERYGSKGKQLRMYYL